MKKVIYKGVRDIRVEDIRDSKPKAGEVRVKVKYCGICGSDLHEYLHGPYPRTTFGHEAVGTIEELGPEVEGFEVGERVCAVVPGSFAESTICPLERLIKIPEDMTWQRAVLIEPLSGAAYAMERGNVQPHDDIFIAGAGTVGLMFLLGCKSIGIKNVYMTDLLDNRLHMAEKLGATMVWNPMETKTSAKVKSLTDGKGADVAIEAVGQPASLKDCLASTRFQGMVIVQGIFTKRAEINMFAFVDQQTTMIGTLSSNPLLALEWLKTGNIEPEHIITKIIPLEDIVKEGFERLTDPENTSDIKILVEP